MSDADIDRFDYIAFKENICIALAVADLVGIPRHVAMDGMVTHRPDPGVLRMRALRHRWQAGDLGEPVRRERP